MPHRYSELLELRGFGEEAMEREEAESIKYSTNSNSDQEILPLLRNG